MHFHPKVMSYTMVGFLEIHKNISMRQLTSIRHLDERLSLNTPRALSPFLPMIILWKKTVLQMRNPKPRLNDLSPGSKLVSELLLKFTLKVIILPTMLQYYW